MDPDVARRHIADADLVAHIASIPRPVGYDAGQVFQTNMTLMFNVLAATEAAGISRLLFASSFSVLGLPFAPRPVELNYLPVDEHHPAQPQDVYAVTKWLGEEMVDAWTRRIGGSAISLRMPWIQTPESFMSEVAKRRLTEEAALDLWAYIDARDAARAFLLAANAQTPGHERFFISAGDSYSETPTADLLAARYPGTQVRTSLEGHAGLLSNDRAKHLIDFVPRYSWRDY
ncbi:NAD(P)-dependent oxidoreductase [Sinorhizobium medicae]|nr:NAD(P)-dependent oxidoreductase [Sinorhizobium medicae]